LTAQRRSDARVQKVIDKEADAVPQKDTASPRRVAGGGECREKAKAQAPT